MIPTKFWGPIWALNYNWKTFLKSTKPIVQFVSDRTLPICCTRQQFQFLEKFNTLIKNLSDVPQSQTFFISQILQLAFGLSIFLYLFLLLWEWDFFLFAPPWGQFWFCKRTSAYKSQHKCQKTQKGQKYQDSWISMNSSVFSVNYLTCFSISSYFIAFVLLLQIKEATVSSASPLLQMWFVQKFLISKLVLLFFFANFAIEHWANLSGGQKQSSTLDYLISKHVRLFIFSKIFGLCGVHLLIFRHSSFFSIFLEKKSKL